MLGFIALIALAQPPFVIRDVRLFDGERTVGIRSVLVRDGRIAAIGDAELSAPGATVIDGRGRTLLPGLIDSHVHVSDSAEADLRQGLSLGVTTMLDMFSGGERYERIKAIRASDPEGLADVRSAGIGASIPGGHPSQMGGPPIPTLTNAAEADAFVAARIAEGSDYLKIIYDDLATFGAPVPMLDRATLTALIDAAHRRGKLSVVHVLSEAHARDAFEAGADGLVHLFTGETVGSDFAALAAKHRGFVIPTLTVLDGSCGIKHGGEVMADTLLAPYVRPWARPMMTRIFPPRGAVRSCVGTREAIRQLALRKVPILAGTDAPAPGQTYGASIHSELALLIGAGLSPSQALTAATAAPARAFRLTDRGRIRPGLRADLLLVDGDPTVDILATRRIVSIWKRGALVRRARFDQ